MDFGLDQFNSQFEKLAKLPKSYRLAILPALAVLVVAAYVYLLYLPQAEQLEGVRTQQLQLHRRLNEVRAVAANIGKFEEEIAALERKLKIALRQLPDSKELPVLLTDINTLGKTSGLDFKAFRPADEVRRDFYAEVPIEVEFFGKFHDVAMFFDEISRLPRIVNVNELSIGIADENSVETVLKVKGEATTFRFIEEAPAQDESDEAAKKQPARRKGR
jgi:type IV pilus assembly protein PilO